MKRLVVLGIVAMACAVAHAGMFLVHVRMHDGRVVTFEVATVPTPDSGGMFRFHLKETGADLIVHGSNVWIEEKTNKGKKAK